MRKILVAIFALSMFISNGQTIKRIQDYPACPPIDTGAIFALTQYDSATAKLKTFKATISQVRDVVLAALPIDTDSVSSPVSDTALYVVYTALLSNSSGTVTAKQLQNNIGDGSADGVNDIAWSNPSNGSLIATMTAAPFTANKVWILSPPFIQGGISYFLSGHRVLGYILSFNILKYDNTNSSTPNFTDIPLEIRIYK